MIILFTRRKCDNCDYVKSAMKFEYRKCHISILKTGARRIYPELVNLLADLAMLDWDGTAPVACWNGEALTYPMICNRLGIPVHTCKEGVCSLS